MLCTIFKKISKNPLNLEHTLLKTVVDDIGLHKIIYSKLGTISLEIWSPNLTHPTVPISQKQKNLNGS